jgi:hypothetical protein
VGDCADDRRTRLGVGEAGLGEDLGSCIALYAFIASSE